jgi:hypothetical protein
MTAVAQDREMKYAQLTGIEYTDPGLTNKGIYLNEDFVPGSVVLNSGDVVSGLYLRYNNLTDQLIWLTKEYGQVKLDKLTVTAFYLTLKETSAYFRQMRLPLGDSVPAYYQDLYKGKVTLLVQRKVSHASDYYQNKTHYSVCKPNPQYYLVVGNKTYHPSRPTIKTIYALFPEKKEQIQHLVRTLHLKDRSEAEFTEFIREVEESLVME